MPDKFLGEGFRDVSYDELSENLKVLQDAVLNKHGKLTVDALHDSRRIPVQFLTTVRDNLHISSHSIPEKQQIMRGAYLCVISYIQDVEYSGRLAESIKSCVTLEKACLAIGLLQVQEAFDVNASSIREALAAFQNYYKTKTIAGQSLREETLFSNIAGFENKGYARSYWDNMTAAIEKCDQKIAQQTRQKTSDEWHRAEEASKPAQPSSFLSRFWSSSSPASSSEPPSASPAPGGPGSR